MSSTIDVLDWALTAEPGAKVDYAKRTWGICAPAAILAIARAANERGYVFLAQRHEPAGVVYEATRISRRTADMLERQPVSMGRALWKC